MSKKSPGRGVKLTGLLGLYAACSVLVLTATVPLSAEVFIYLDKESEWRMLPGTAEASDPDPGAWRLPGFDDSAWMAAPAPVGYGRGSFGTDLALLDPPMRNNYSSIFLRREFEIRKARDVIELVANLTVDDGVIMWINGQEVFRSNVDGATGDFLPFDATATRSLLSSPEVRIDLSDPMAYIVDGTNTIAVQVFNSSIGNGDVFFELEFENPAGPDLIPPLVTQTIPTQGTTVKRLSHVEVYFDEPVIGVGATDLLINGLAAEGLFGEGRGPYLFTFTEPAAGPVQIEWREGHGITDAVIDLNPFAGTGWSYVLDPARPPDELVITEFQAANGRTLPDEDGDDSDWLEIENRGTQVADLGGWTLTDNLDQLTKWSFPSHLLQPGEHLVVFASGKNRREPGEELHTNFSLSEEGESLALANFDEPRVVVSEYRDFPAQRFDYSYGLGSDGSIGYFDIATPGRSNDEGSIFPGFAQEPRFSETRGHYESGFDLELTPRNPAGTVYYTLDGSTPTPENGIVYDGAIDIAGDPLRAVVTVRAMVAQDGLLPSSSATHSYVFPEHVLTQPADPEGFPGRWNTQLADYEMDPRVINRDPDLAREGIVAVPSLLLTGSITDLFSTATGLYANPHLSGQAFERPISAELVYPDGEKRGFQINCGLRTQGGSSTIGWKSRKVSLRLLFKGEYGATRLKHPVFEDSPVTRFNTLLADAGMNLTLNHPDSAQRTLTQQIRDQYVSDLQNEAGGYGHHAIYVNLFLNGLFWGVYYFHERCDAAFAAEYFGGEREDYDAMRHTATTTVDGTNDAFLELTDRVENSLISDENLLAVEEYLDLDNFADYILVNFYTGNTDWDSHNWYATRKRQPGAPWRFHSWDAEHTLKGLLDDVTSRNVAQSPSGIFQKLATNEEFRLLVADHVQRHFFNDGMLSVNAESPAWDPETPTNNRPALHYMRRAEEIRQAIVLEFARWGNNQSGGTGHSYDVWVNELDRLLTTYFPERTQVVLDQLRGRGLYPATPVPTFSQHGGEVGAGFVLEIELAADSNGTIYYTTDGSDPREFLSGQIGATAAVYTEPLVINQSTIVRTRNLEAPLWSPINEAAFSIPSSDPVEPVISEIFYNPTGSDDLEFIELHNPGTGTISLAGVTFTDGITHVFEAADRIEAGASVVLARSADAFRLRFPDAPLLGAYTGGLSNGGERVTLSDSEGNTLFSVEYNDTGFWPVGADGFGYSIVLADFDLDPDDPRAWRVSAELDGSPGGTDPSPPHGPVFVNEVRVDSELGENFVELINPGVEAVDIGGWYLSADRTDENSLRHTRIPQGLMLAPGELLVVDDSSGLPLTAAGGALYLTAVDDQDFLTGHIAEVRHDAAEGGTSFGRHETSNGLDFTVLSPPSPGSTNSAPRSPEIAINEIHYHPRLGEDEFLELHNPSSAAKNLSDWVVTGILGEMGTASFVFPEGTRIESRSYLVLVAMDPELFRTIYGVPEAIAILGPYGGGLDNSGEWIRLFKPTETDDAYALVDAVRFNDREPWPLEADGDGSSLERIQATQYGNEVENWDLSMDPGGSPGELNSVSAIIEPPEGGYQVPGDANQDVRLNILDSMTLLRVLFIDSLLALPCDGGLTSPGNRGVLDANDSGGVDLADAVHLLNYMFRRGPEHARGGECRRITGCGDTCQ